MYNLEQVFAQLDLFRPDGDRLDISEEVHATHSSIILDYMRLINPFPDFFLDALNNRVLDSIMPDFGPGDFARLGDLTILSLGIWRVPAIQE